MPKRCRTVISDGKGSLGQRRDGMGVHLADVAGQWNSGRETCIFHLPKNPNQFFVLATSTPQFNRGWCVWGGLSEH